MKTLASTVAVLFLSAGFVSAQNLLGASTQLAPATSAPASAHDVTGFSAPNTPGPGVTEQSLKNPPQLHPDLRPRVGGIVVDTVKYGPVMISPTAPARYGIGANYLSAPSPSYDLQHESGYAAHRDAGGLKLFSFEF